MYARHKTLVRSIQFTHHDDVRSQPSSASQNHVHFNKYVPSWWDRSCLGRFKATTCLVLRNKCYIRWKSNFTSVKLCDLGSWSSTQHVKSKYESKTKSHVKKPGGKKPFHTSRMLIKHAEQQYIYHRCRIGIELCVSVAQLKNIIVYFSVRPFGRHLKNNHQNRLTSNHNVSLDYSPLIPTSYVPWSWYNRICVVVIQPLMESKHHGYINLY